MYLIKGGLLMPGISYPFFKDAVAAYLKNILPKNSLVLDIGPGAGVYYNLLGDYFQMEAVEIFAPNITQEKLREKYVQVYCDDIRTFDLPHVYDLIIMGDVLEHLSVNDAQNVLEKLKAHTEYLMVAVPYNLAQGQLYGNEAEIHLQPDLSIESFDTLYPGFTRIYGNSQYGYYLWCNNNENCV